ncbi:MAG: class I SAM-dependent methyltransferase [Propionivibrio sp.]
MKAELLRDSIDSICSVAVRVDSLGDAYTDAAASWARRLHLPQIGAARCALQIGPDGLQVVEVGDLSAHAAGPVGVDFATGAMAHRRRFGGGRGQLIARAVGLQLGIRPTVVDATAGLGRDAFVLAQLGCTVTLIERQPLIAALLEDGLQRALTDTEVSAIVARMRLLPGDAIELMRAWPDAPPQVVYLDPMFPHRDKSALVKKEMRIFRLLAGDDLDAPALLAAALDLATHRVVVKRPRKAPAIAGEAPGYVLEGESSRYDVYPKQALKLRA